MSKSKYVFLIMFFGYLAIAILNAFNVMPVGDRILLGLSLCAMTMSLSDCVSESKVLLLKTNELNYVAQVSINFITANLKINVPRHNPKINIRNVKVNIADSNKGYEKSQHPSLYKKKKIIKILNIIEIFLFTVSIFIFVMTPFANVSMQLTSKVTVLITLLAFGFVCLNVYLSEINAKKSERINDFFNSTQVIIDSVFPDFSSYLNHQLYYREDLVAVQEEFEARLNEVATNDDINVTK